MKKTITAILLASSLIVTAKEPATKSDKKAVEKTTVDPEATHLEKSDQLSIEQDKQASNVIELIIEQTNPKVVELLMEVEVLMANATDNLEEGNTGIETITTETEIIEKIFEAAKEKSQ